MTAEEYTPHGDNPPTRAVRDLRLHAEQLVRTESDLELLEIVDELRADEDMWPHLWGPASAIAAVRLGRADGLELLRSAIKSGFSQPELFEGDLEKQFAASAEWPELVAEMAANVPAPGFVLLDWPDPGAVLPLELFTIAPDRAEAFAARLPSPASSSWETAQALLIWVRRSWEHANDHVDNPDGLDVLERVDAGERFACVEYSIVLSQALNALRIPARRVDLRQLNHHVGVGRGHVVSEAWIDELDRWVVLDGQNGAYWVGADGTPLGLRDLQRADPAEPLRMVGLVKEMTGGDAATWRTYFASASTTGYTWAEQGFAPVFQGMAIIKTSRLLHDGELAYPRLSVISVGLSGTVQQPTIRLATPHPYATGFRVDYEGVDSEVDLESARWSVPPEPGRHTVAISTLTAYGATRPSVLTYEIGQS